jgi:hypothetical protein
MLASSKKISSQGRENISGQMENATKESGSTDLCMA